MQPASTPVSRAASAHLEENLFVLLHRLRLHFLELHNRLKLHLQQSTATFRMWGHRQQHCGTVWRTCASSSGARASSSPSASASGATFCASENGAAQRNDACHPRSSTAHLLLVGHVCCRPGSVRALWWCKTRVARVRQDPEIGAMLLKIGRAEAP
eukprot:scaffold3418_cov124-Isochrysis_galbana.AAC.20